MPRKKIRCITLRAALRGVAAVLHLVARKHECHEVLLRARDSAVMLIQFKILARREKIGADFSRAKYSKNFAGRAGKFRSKKGGRVFRVVEFSSLKIQPAFCARLAGGVLALAS